MIRSVWLLGLMVAACASGPTPRGSVAPVAFQRGTPCPSTGMADGPCPGWVRDHVTPLCAGGADAPENMQWQTMTAAKAKDANERRQCAALRKERRDGNDRVR